MIQLPRAVSSNAPQTQNRKRLLAEITSEQMGLCSREYRRHLAVCEEYGAEPTNFVIFAACTMARKATNETAVSQARD